MSSVPDPASPSVPNGVDPIASARLACSGITVRFGGLVAVDNVDLHVEPGQVVGLVGPNGAGKSTLFAVASGLLRPSSGHVSMGGEDVTGDSPQSRSARGLARTFQHPELFTGLTVREHLILAYRVRHRKSRVWTDLFTMGSLRGGEPGEADAVDDLIDLLGLAPVADQTALGLPLGFARLVELGRALAREPTLLLLDEPSSGLDSSETARFEETLGSVAKARNISVLLVEHDFEMVIRMCSNIYVLDFGRLIASGTPDAVRSNPAVRAAYLGEELEEATDAPQEEIEIELGEVVGLTADGTTALPRPEAEAHGIAVTSPAAVLLSVENLSVRYGDALALLDVSFQVGAGQTIAILGANGAGKSSLARVLSGLVPCSDGSIMFDEKRIDGWSADRIRRAGVVHLPEGRGVFRSMSVIDNVKMAANVIPTRQLRHEAVDRAMEIFPVLAARKHQVAGSLSGGEQQMLSLARALATSPRLIIADEMSLGLAPKMVDLVFEGLDRARRTGISVIMIEQYVHRALAFADDCIFLQRGSVTWAGPTDDAGDDVLSHYLGSAMTATA